jgi:hypothetical protein
MYSKEPRTALSVDFIYSRLALFFSDTSVQFFYFPYVNLLLLLLAVGLSFITKNIFIKKVLMCSILIIFTDALFAVLNKDIVAARAFACELVSYIFIIASCLYLIPFKEIKSTFRYALAVCVLVILFSCSYYNNKDYLNPPYYQEEVKIISDILLKNNVTTCYVNNSNFWIHYPIIQYYYTIQHKNWILYTSDANSTRFAPFNLKVKYDCIITELNVTQQLYKGYDIIYKGSDFLIFLSKNKIR